MNNPLEKQLKALINLFKATKTPYVILGGLAVMLYGEPRLTLDIDVNVSLTRDKIKSFLLAARRCGFIPVPSNINLFVKRTGVIPLKFTKGDLRGRCDIIIAENPIEYAALKRAKIKKIGSLKAKFVTPEDLVIHKITSDRPRDIEDLKGILSRQVGKLDTKYILFWLKKIAKVSNKPDLVTLFKDLLRKYTA